jgi:hypothetical protein
VAEAVAEALRAAAAAHEETAALVQHAVEGVVMEAADTADTAAIKVEDVDEDEDEDEGTIVVDEADSPPVVEEVVEASSPRRLSRELKWISC